MAVVEACYLYNLEKHPLRPSIRIAANRLLTTDEIERAFNVIESVSSNLIQ